MCLVGFYYFYLIRAAYVTEFVAEIRSVDFLLEINMLLYCWEKVKMPEYSFPDGVSKVRCQTDLL